MSKEFQIRDGNLIASFDLENEDGDIDFCKLLKVSHGVADEIGMFVDYVATNKIIKDQSKQISDLEAKLAEKDRAIENWQTMYESVVQTCYNDKEEIERLNKRLAMQENTITNLVEDNRASQEWYKKQLAEKEEEITQRLVIQERDYDQDKISFAVEQLEKVKEFCDGIKLSMLYISQEDTTKIQIIIEEINNQIKQLKEKK